LTEAERNRATVTRLLDILSGKSPIESGVELIAQDVVANVDGWRFQGINVWANWIQYLRTRGRMDALTLFVDEVTVNQDATVTARGCWSAMRGERRVFSKSCSARYRLENGRIVEIWSTRRNYAFMCGVHTEGRAGFAAELVACVVVEDARAAARPHRRGTDRAGRVPARSCDDRRDVRGGLTT